MSDEYNLSTKISANQNKSNQNAKLGKYKYDKTGKNTLIKFP